MNGKKNANDVRVPLVGKVEPSLRKKVEKLAERKGWTVSLAVRNIVKSHFSKAA